MNILLYNSAAIAALSLVLIAVFIFLLFKSTKKTMDTLQETVGRVQTDINGITARSNELMDKTNRIASNVEQKVQSLDQLTKTAETFNRSTAHLEQSFDSLSKEVAAPGQKYSRLLDNASLLTEASATIYYRLKKYKKTRERETAAQDVPRIEYNGMK